MWKKLSKSKKISFIASLVIAFIVLFGIFVNLILGGIAENRIREALGSSKEGYQVDFHRASINLFTMSVILKDVTIFPDSALMEDFKSHLSIPKTLYKADIPVLRFRHLDALSILGARIISIQEILFDQAALTIYTGGGKPEKHVVTEERVDKGININRIAVNKIGGIDIGIVRFNDFMLFVVDPLKEDTILYNRGSDFVVDNLSLVKNKADTNTFRLRLTDARLKIVKEKEHDNFDFSIKDYNISFTSLLFSVKSKSLHLENFTIIPKKNMYAMASAMKFRGDVFNVVVDQLDLHFGDVKKMILSGGYHFPLVEINGLKLFIMRNRSLPFDESMRPLLPNQLLKNMSTGLTIDSIFIRNSQLVYEESNNDKAPNMKVSLDELDVLISQITSVKDSMSNETPMKISMMAKLEKTIPLKVDFTFPLLSKSDTFNYHGTLGSGHMSVFNPMLESAVGVNFSEGELKSIEFAVEANSNYAMGSMTMLYNNLDGNVLRHDGKDNNKVLSWIANQVIKADNPFPGDKPREVSVFFKRVMYKGFGNFAFKSLLSGILASTIPVFEKSNQKGIDEVNQTTKKDLRKRKREAKRKDR